MLLLRSLVFIATASAVSLKQRRVVSISDYTITNEAINLQFNHEKPQLTSEFAQSLQKRDLNAGPADNRTTSLNYLSQEYLAPVTIAGRPFELIVDTGSSTTWIADAFFTCVHKSPIMGEYAVAQEYCAWGNTLPRGLPEKMVKHIANYNFEDTYGDGSYAGGELVVSPVKLSKGIIVNQWVGLANAVGWYSGNNRTSGILGLGGSGLTSRYPGTDRFKDVKCPTPSETVLHRPSPPCNEEQYISIVDNIYLAGEDGNLANNQTLVQEKYFTLALSRATSGTKNAGQLTFDGIPNPSDPKINITDPVAIVPLETRRLGDLKNTTRDGFYTISIDGISITLPAFTNFSSSDPELNFTRRSRYYQHKPRAAATSFVGMSQDDGKAQYIVDSGTSVIQLPFKYADMINSQFNPPISAPDTFDCDPSIKVPSVSFVIGGQSFLINPEDMIINTTSSGYDNEGNPETRIVCFSAFQPGFPNQDGSTVGILGQPFLKNVLAVFDVGQKQLGFAARPYYES